jgi:hypothetical protein
MWSQYAIPNDQKLKYSLHVRLTQPYKGPNLPDLIKEQLRYQFNQYQRRNHLASGLRQRIHSDSVVSADHWSRYLSHNQLGVESSYCGYKVIKKISDQVTAYQGR